MSVILDYLQIRPEELTQVKDGVKTWIFPKTLDSADKDFLQNKITDVQQLIFLYSSARSSLIKLLKNTSIDNIPEYAGEIEKMLAFAIILEKLEKSYLNAKGLLQRLKKDQKNFRMLLIYLGFRFEDAYAEELITTKQVEAKVRHWTLTLNWPRFFFIRGRRFLLSLDAFLNYVPEFHKILQKVEYITLPLNNYISWLFFAPRLMVNLFNLAKHTTAGWWMPESEKQLGFKKQFTTQFSMRWFEIFTDAVWFTGGLLGCFVFTQLLAPMAIYLMLSLQIYDMLLASYRLFHEIQRLDSLHNLFENCPDEEEYIKKDLEESISIEKDRALMLLMQNISLFIAVGLMLPVFVNPAFALAGGIILLVTTVVSLGMNLHLDAKKANIENEQLDAQNFKEVSRLGLFGDRGKGQEDPPANTTNTNVDDFETDLTCNYQNLAH